MKKLLLLSFLLLTLGACKTSDFVEPVKVITDSVPDNNNNSGLGNSLSVKLNYTYGIGNSTFTGSSCLTADTDKDLAVDSFTNNVSSFLSTFGFSLTFDSTEDVSNCDDITVKSAGYCTYNEGQQNQYNETTLNNTSCDSHTTGTWTEHPTNNAVIYEENNTTQCLLKESNTWQAAIPSMGGTITEFTQDCSSHTTHDGICELSNGVKIYLKYDFSNSYTSETWCTNQKNGTWTAN